MSNDRLHEPQPRMYEPTAELKKVGRFQTGVRSLIVLVATGGALIWSARGLWENQHPAIDAARGLNAKSPSERVDAIGRFAQVGIGDAGLAIPPLLVALKDAQVPVRVAACEALTQLTSEAFIAHSAEDAVRAAVTALIGSLKDPEVEVRIAAARALNYVASASGPARMIDYDGIFGALSGMLGDRQAAVHLAVLEALASTARRVALSPPDALAAELVDESPDVRAAAVKSFSCFQVGLDRWMPRIFEVLERETDPGARKTAVNALIQVRSPMVSTLALPALVAGLSSRYREVQYGAVYLIGTLGSDSVVAIPDLIEVMSHPIDPKMDPGISHPANWDPAWLAAEALGKIDPGGPSAGIVLQALTEILRVGHPYRRAAAARVLGEFGPAAVAAVPALISVVRENAGTKAGLGDGGLAAAALGRIAPGTPHADEAVTALTEALEAKSEHTRDQAIEALMLFGPKAAVAIPRIRALVNDPIEWVRSDAAKALAKLAGAK